MSLLEARDFTVYRGDRAVAHAAELSVDAGETLAVLGPNGAGKSSLLLGLAALLTWSGEVRFRDQTVRDLAAYRRRNAVVFQRPLLLDRSVRDNVAIGLALRGVSARDRALRADAELGRLGIADLARRPAHALSGGEAQRVSIARALALDPQVLFLDEPFASLDAPTRESLTGDLARALRGRGFATVLVTHDRDEALSLGDRVAVVMAGRVRQVDRADVVFATPADPEVADFVGVENIIPARVVRIGDELTELRIADHIVETTSAPPPGESFPLLCVAPDDVLLSRGELTSSARNHYPARVVRLDPIGRRSRVVLDCGFPLVAHVTRQSARELALHEGDDIVASFKATVPHLLPRHRRT